jgi:hypothetical protein
MQRRHLLPASGAAPAPPPLGAGAALQAAQRLRRRSAPPWPRSCRSWPARRCGRASRSHPSPPWGSTTTTRPGGGWWISCCRWRWGTARSRCSWRCWAAPRSSSRRRASGALASPWTWSSGGTWRSSTGCGTRSSWRSWSSWRGAPACQSPCAWRRWRWSKPSWPPALQLSQRRQRPAPRARAWSCCSAASAAGGSWASWRARSRSR